MRIRVGPSATSRGRRSLLPSTARDRSVYKCWFPTWSPPCWASCFSQNPGAFSSSFLSTFRTMRFSAKWNWNAFQGMAKYCSPTPRKPPNDRTAYATVLSPLRRPTPGLRFSPDPDSWCWSPVLPITVIAGTISLDLATFRLCHVILLFSAYSSRGLPAFPADRIVVETNNEVCSHRDTSAFW